MSVPPARVPNVTERWDRARVLALAPDASAQRAARALAGGPSWLAAGAGPELLWGECRGSASAPYRTVVDLSGPAYRCSCPSRRFPCKHALALLLLWADGAVPPDAGEPPGWAARLAGRPRGQGEPSCVRPARPAEGPEDGGQARRAARGPGRVRPGRARPVALRPGTPGPGRQPAGRIRPLGRHRRPDGRRAGPGRGRAAARSRRGPAFRARLGRPPPRGVRAAAAARRRLPPAGRIAGAAAGDRPVAGRVQPAPGGRAGRRRAGPGPLAGAGPPGYRAGPGPGPPDLAARPHDRPARARAQLRPGRRRPRRLAHARHRNRC